MSKTIQTQITIKLLVIFSKFTTPGLAYGNLGVWPLQSPPASLKVIIRKNGVAALHHNLTLSGGDKLYYQVYDPTRGVWNYGFVGGAAGDVIGEVTIHPTNGAIGYRLNGSPILSKGYSVSTGAWENGWPDLYAGFVAQPAIGNAPLAVWVTDMSLGAVAGGSGVTFGYDWGDGTAASTNRSGFHTYTGPNTYDLSLTVTRGIPPGSDTRTTRITVSANPAASLPVTELLLLGD
jgi:PKD repeat protein